MKRSYVAPIQPVVLYTHPNNYREPEDGETLTVIGYGMTEYNGHFGMPQYIPQHLQAAKVQYSSDCVTASEYEKGQVDEPIQFCAGVPEGGKDHCYGK